MEVIKMQNTIFVIAAILMNFHSVVGQYLEDSCFLESKNVTGRCVEIDDCEQAKIDFSNGIRPQICSFGMKKPIICCEEVIKEPEKQSDTPEQLNQSKTRISFEKCMEYEKLLMIPKTVGSLTFSSNKQTFNVTKCGVAESLIKGGSDAGIAEFPHMAALGKSDEAGIKWTCGGILISKNFVLSAAHCMKTKSKPNVVRLGDHNLVSDEDQTAPQEFEIKNIIKHPNYKFSSKYDDIALVELDRKARFTPFVRPACLWQTETLNKTSVTATGWGLLDIADTTSDKLQKVSLNVIDNSVCDPYFDQIRKFDKSFKEIKNTQMCAGAYEGGEITGSKDTCSGDSGGPLQVTADSNNCLFYVVGITSFSVGCGLKNTPGIYTLVSAYLDWIEPIVWPN